MSSVAEVLESQPEQIDQPAITTAGDEVALHRATRGLMQAVVVPVGQAGHTRELALEAEADRQDDGIESAIATSTRCIPGDVPRSAFAQVDEPGVEHHLDAGGAFGECRPLRVELIGGLLGERRPPVEQRQPST
jgi:hypothetical protein